MLRPGGLFYIMEEHPFVATLYEHEPRPGPGNEYSYFGAYNYFQDELTHQWNHCLADVLNALIRAGLRIEAVNEMDETFYQRCPYMIPTDREEKTWCEGL